MNDDELSVLRAVVDERGFGRAAKRVHLSQSAVSQAIARLETELGCRLLERGRPPTLTPAGQRVYEHALDVLSRRELLTRQLRAVDAGDAGLVALASSQALSREVLPPLVAGFALAHPRAAFQLETLPSRQIISAVTDGRIELGLGPFSRAMAGLTLHPLGKQRMVLYAGRGSRLGKARHVTIAALADETLVTSHLDASAGKRGLLREHFGAVWVVQGLDLRLRLIADGLAVGYLPESTVEQAKATRSLRPLDALVPFGAIERTYGLFASARRAPSTMAQRFIAFATAKKQKPRGSHHGAFAD